MEILTEICQELRNWFNRNQKRYHGKITINGGSLSLPDESLEILSGQYFLINGSVFNDGVHKQGEALIDETFSGTICGMAIPQAVLDLAKDVEDWMAKYGAIDGVLMSPYSSESFGGYSYSKASGGYSSGSGASGGVSWQSMFADRLNRWRKI